MNNASTEHRRNLFEIENARNLSIQELVETFIPTQSFWRLLSAKHHVVLGARGQGKTALVRMISHNHLSLLAEMGNEPRAVSAINKQEFIGIYVPTRLEWVGGLRNKPWLNEQEQEQLFQWRLNLSCCIAFIPVAKSCIKQYVSSLAQRAELEYNLTQQLACDWLGDNGEFQNLVQLQRHLEDVDYRNNIRILMQHSGGKSAEPAVAKEEHVFGTDLFIPLRQGIKQLSRLLDINPNCTWLLCIDEAEFLDKLHHRILNSHMRAYPDNLFLKITTMPYCHYTLETNIGVSLVNGEDFQYINMDTDRVMTARIKGEPDTIGTLFGRTLFGKLFEASEPPVDEASGRKTPTARDLLGDSLLLDPNREEWSEGSENMRLLEKYASQETIKRAQRLIGTDKFRDEISRKIHGALLLRKEVDELKGHKTLTLYSGARMAIRCAGGNPRHMIRIFNAMRMCLTKTQKGFLAIRLKVSPISPQEQTNAMQMLATTTLNQVRSLPDVGPQLHNFLVQLGEYMRSNFYGKPVSTDQVTSVRIGNDVSDDIWKLIEVAVGHGLLHPNTGVNNTDEMPWKSGTFHLTYALAPHFLLLPRRGKSVNLSTVLQFGKMNNRERDSFVKNDQAQMFLFEGGELK